MLPLQAVWTSSSRVKARCYVCDKLGHEAKCWLVRRGTNRDTKTPYKVAAVENKFKDEHSFQRSDRELSARLLCLPTVLQAQCNTSYLNVMRSLTLETKEKVLVSNNTRIVKTVASENMLIANGWIGDVLR